MHKGMKYGDLILLLHPETIYTPAAIAHFAIAHNYIVETDPEKRKRIYSRIRLSMGRFSNNHEFPDQGDGFVVLKGQAPTPGWYGWRWQQALGEKNEETR